MKNLNLRKQLLDGEKKFGVFMKCPFIEIAELIGYAGYDFGVIDRQHAIFTDMETENMIIGLESAEAMAIVRLPSPAEEHIIHALDSGAEGIIIPGLSSVEEARKTARMLRFFPKGARGMNGGARAAKHGFTPRAEYMDGVNDSVITMIMMESLEMIGHADELGEIENIDGFFIGPADLSQDMGIPGQMDHPDLMAIIGELCKKAVKHKKFVGAFAGSRESAERLTALGVNFITYSTDLSLLKGALVKTLDSLKAIK